MKLTKEEESEMLRRKEQEGRCNEGRERERESVKRRGFIVGERSSAWAREINVKKRGLALGMIFERG